jgi:hypothetical protein
VNRPMLLPGGLVVRQCNDDAAVKALAIRLGVYPQIVAGMRSGLPRPASAALCRDGDTLHAILLLSGWADPKDNGWVALSATPACEQGQVFLERFVRTAIAGSTGRTEEAIQSWNN